LHYLLDTDTCIDLLRGLSTVVQKLETLAPDDCVISAITSFELFAGPMGARDPNREREKIERLLQVLKEAPFEARAARGAGVLRSQLEKAGRLIGPYDLLIAAHALTLDLVLVTANKREFGRVTNLRIENWR
jgi:tRNA(fMet)-specific endonuclease VapC